MIPLIIYHGGCPDGYGAAWWLGRQLGDHEKYPAKYNTDPPYDIVEGRDVFIVDFAYEPERLDMLTAAMGPPAQLLVIDHHQTSKQWIGESSCEVTDNAYDAHEAITDGVRAVALHNEQRSGVGLVTEWVSYESIATTGVDLIAPSFLLHIEDRDLWKMGLPNTEEVYAAVTSRPYTDEAWDEMLRLGQPRLVTEGIAIQRYREQIIEHCVSTAHNRVVGRFREHGDGDVEIFLAAQCPYQVGSDVASRLAAMSPNKIGAYFIDKGHETQWGLRSTNDGPDVAVIAERFGGGGHKHAAGFTIPR